MAYRLATRWLSCIRFDEVAALQATPFIGAVFALGSLSVAHFQSIAILVAANICLVAHVFVLNDWSGIEGDLKDPNRSSKTFSAKGLTPREVGGLAGLLLVISLLLFALVSWSGVFFAGAIAALSALYSFPTVHWKGFPFLNSALHFVGGSVHFLLGYAAFSAVDMRAVIVAVFFGLVFTAGHFTHEVKDCDIDRANGIRTNAVVFGKVASFSAGFVLFMLAYAYLIILASLGYAPSALVFAAGLIPIHILASFQALKAGLTPVSLGRLQRCYRLLFTSIGVVMIISLVFA